VLEEPATLQFSACTMEVPGLFTHGVASQKLNLDDDCCKNVKFNNKKIFFQLITVSNISLKRKFVSSEKSKETFV
jgi:hypothetical protein